MYVPGVHTLALRDECVHVCLGGMNPHPDRRVCVCVSPKGMNLALREHLCCSWERSSQLR